MIEEPNAVLVRSRVPRTGAAFGRRAEVARVRSRADYDYDGGATRRSSHAVARRARASLPASPVAAAPVARVESAREFERSSAGARRARVSGEIEQPRAGRLFSAREGVSLLFASNGSVMATQDFCAVDPGASTIVLFFAGSTIFLRPL